MAGVLLATLAEEPDGTDVLFEHGNPDWMLPRSSDKPVAMEPPGPTPAGPVDARHRRLKLAVDQGTARKLPTRAPSSRQAAAGTIGELLSGKTRQAAKERGTVLHAGLSEIDWLEDSRWKSRILDRLRRQFPTVDDVERLVGDLTAMVGRPVLQQLLTRKSYLDQMAQRVALDQLVFDSLTATVENERGFAVRLDDAIVQGSIDRLVWIHEGNKPLAAEVIEYKTDRSAELGSSEVERLIDHYQPQVQLYRRAVAHWSHLPLERVYARLVLPGIDREYEVR
jgi:ATP-dependent exoDNAse (exonuclease V) beta subunit